ncbi:MAG: permease [Clostridiales bacterium]|nr:permease [Clostridiales bacterium]MCF8021485.1 permease [Clostridiales bacterium]
MKEFWKKYWSLPAAVVVFSMVGIIWPGKMVDILPETCNFLLQVILIVPAVLLLMGLFEVWVPRSLVKKQMGSGSGIRGIVLAFVFGTAPTGPLYIAFPIAVALLKKGARVSNVAVFLGAWAAAKVPQIMVEIQFLGPAFAVVRLTMTFIAIVIIGYLVEYFSGPANIRE